MAVSFHLYPPENVEIIDSKNCASSFLVTESAYVTFHGTALSDNKPGLMLVGASNVGAGFRPQDLAPLPPNMVVHNLAISGSNIDGVRAVIDLIYANRRPEQRQNLIMVLGLWYGMFLHLESNPSQTLVGRQLHRFGLYESEGASSERRLSTAQFESAVTLLRPFFLTQALLGAQGPLANSLWPSSEQQNGDVFIPPSGDKRDFPLPPAQFEALIDIAQLVKEKGGKLVIIDLPLPKPAENAPLWHRYQQDKIPYFERAGALGASIVNMQDMNCPCDFSGGTHPIGLAVPRWSSRLIEELKKTSIIPSTGGPMN
jgi:hypothetical protein